MSGAHGAALLEAMQQWLLIDNTVMDRLDAFAAAHVQYFDYVADPSQYSSTENKLHYTTIYNEFQALFEHELSVFLTQQGCDMQTFLQICAEEEQRNPDGVPLHHWLAAMSEYDEFKKFMLDHKRRSVEGQ